MMAGLAAVCPADQPLTHAQGEMAGEPTQTSVFLQTRLTKGDQFIGGDIPGAEGTGRFELSRHVSFLESSVTPWQEAVPENDFIIRQQVEGLQPDTRYFYRLHYGPDTVNIRIGPTREFTTLPDTARPAPVSFAVVTGMNYDKFHYGWPWRNRKPYSGADRHLGYPALETIREMGPDFFIGTGDNVYYDELRLRGAAQSVEELRRKWHEQFVQPRFVDLFARIPTYWMKDDHDHRFNDCDTTGDRAPSNALGIATFREQMPVVEMGDSKAVTYRTHRMGKHLQIWLLEGRDYRSPNEMPDGPDKTIWGSTQKEWLKRTLLASEATFKLLISPTPLVGPDDGYKSDNHTNPKGFRHEGEAFFAWLKAHGFLQKNFYIVCGDRHWQYHSMHPSGFEEFSCGALVENNARLGRSPGDPESTDPEALVTQIYTQQEPSAGFLMINLLPGTRVAPARLVFNFYDEHGTLLFSHEKHSD